MPEKICHMHPCVLKHNIPNGFLIVFQMFPRMRCVRLIYNYQVLFSCALLRYLTPICTSQILTMHMQVLGPSS